MIKVKKKIYKKPLLEVSNYDDVILTSSEKNNRLEYDNLSMNDSNK